jgi:hypothetical protein
MKEMPKGPPSKCSPMGDRSEHWKHVCQVRSWYLKYKDRLKNLASAGIFFISVKKAKHLYKTGPMQSHDISPPSYITLNPLLSITPVQRQSKWKAVRMCSSNSVLLLRD